MTDSSMEPYNKITADPDKTALATNNAVEKEQINESKNKENCGTDEPATTTLAGINTDTQEQEAVATTVDELSSDGSASAFEGTESIDSHEMDLELARKAEQLKNDPSGRSNY